MFGMSLSSWYSKLLRRGGHGLRRIRRVQPGRPLRLEALEDRFLLSGITITVTGLGGDAGSYNPATQQATTLAAAITQANTDNAGDTIVFSNGLSGPIDLNPNDAGNSSAVGTLTLSGDMTIQGPSDNGITIEGGSATGVTTNAQVFVVNAGVTATLDHLVISNGYTAAGPGGGIKNLGNLTLTNSAVSGNSASTSGGGIFNNGTLTLTNSTISGNSAAAGFGGGISNAATLMLTDSTVSGNSAKSLGGGIYNSYLATATITNSALTNNTTKSGGAIYNYTATLTITNSTISGNTATTGVGGGIRNNYGTATLNNSTISGNSAHRCGGLYIDAGHVTLNNTILAGNSGGSYVDLGNYASGTVSGDFNLTGPGVVITGGTHNVQTSTPLLSTLGNYGGPTQTVALLPGSPALGAGNSALASAAGVTADQRGQPLASPIDIGAFQSAGFSLNVVSGGGQQTPIDTAFSSPIVINVTPNHSGDPVNGGLLTATGPASGASASFSNLAIASGQAGVTATANGSVGGPYNVTFDSGAGTATFQLTNTFGVTASTTNRVVHAPTLIIQGNGFDPLGTNSVAFSSGAVGTVTNVTSTQITVTFTTPPTPGPLTAIVTVDGVSSASTQVATVVAGPSVTTNFTLISASATTVTITGSAFDPTPGHNSVILSSGASGIVTAATPTQLTVQFVSPPTAGNLTAIVTTDGDSSAATVVAGVVPIVSASSASQSAYASTLTIGGAGFDPIATNNSVLLSSGAQGFVTAATNTQLTVTYFTLPSAGPLTATVTTDGVSSGSAVQVAIVLTPSAPTVTSSTTAFAANATTLVITGTGFDPRIANDSVMFSSGAATITAATTTQLTLTFSTPPVVGPLTAKVTTNSLSSTTTQVAAVIPGLNASTANLPASATTLTITGAGFDPAAGNNLVILSSGAGVVISATATSLTVSYTTKPTAGLLSALVITDGINSGSLTSVATVVPTVTSSTANLATTATTLVIHGAGFDPIAARDLVALSSGSGVVTAATATQLTVTFSSPPALGMLSTVVVVDGVASGSLTQVANVTLLTKVGSFNTVGLTATAGTTAANLAVFNNTVQGNASATATVSNIGLNKTATLVARYGGTGNSNMYLGGIQNISGSFFAVIQKNVAGVVTTLFKSAALSGTQFPGSATITFEALGPSLRLFLNGTLMRAVTDTSFTKGSVGISGGAGTKFSNFNASAINLQNATLPFNDSFAATTDGQLSTFWTDQLGNFTVPMVPSSGTGASASSTATNLATVNGATTADDTISATVGPLAAGQSAAVVARYQSNATMYYAGVFYSNGKFYAQIWKIVGGVAKNLALPPLGLLGSSFSGGTITFTLTGSSLHLTVGSTTVSVTDTSITAAGRVGIRGTPGSTFSAFSA